MRTWAIWLTKWFGLNGHNFTISSPSASHTPPNTSRSFWRRRRPAVSGRAGFCPSRGLIRLHAHAFQLHMPHGLASAETLLGVKNFQPGQPAFAVVISGDALGQMFGGDGGVAECDAQGVHFGVIADFHNESKVVCINGYHNYFFRLVHEHGANLPCRVNFAVPVLTERKIFAAI